MKHNNNQIEHGKEFYEKFLVQKPDETRDINLQRRRIFFKVLVESGQDIEEAIKYSNLGVNIKYMKCEYPAEVMAKYNKYMSHWTAHSLLCASIWLYNSYSYQ